MAVLRRIYFNQRGQRLDPKREHLGLEAQHPLDKDLKVVVRCASCIWLIAETLGGLPTLGDIFFDNVVREFDAFRQWAAAGSAARRIWLGRFGSMCAVYRARPAV